MRAWFTELLKRGLVQDLVGLGELFYQCASMSGGRFLYPWTEV